MVELEKAISGIQQAVGKSIELKTLGTVISNIETAFETHWKNEHLPQAEELKEVIEHGIPTPVLTICGRGTQEIRYTSYLGYYMNPRKNHGLGSSLLKAVLGPYVKGLQENWAEECQVETELWIGDFISKQGKNYGCFCDIGVIGKDFAFIIEQKILSGEDPGSQVGLSQLKRYSAVLENNPDYSNKVVIKIFLTPTGRLPEKALGWLPLSYTQVIERAHVLYNDVTLMPVARANLCRLLMDLVMGPYKETDELVEEIKLASAKILKESFNLQAIMEFRRLMEEKRLFINLLKGAV